MIYNSIIIVRRLFRQWRYIKKGIEFEKITDEAEVLACADRYEIDNVPFAITSDGVVLNSSVEIIEFANKGNQ